MLVLCIQARCDWGASADQKAGGGWAVCLLPNSQTPEANQSRIMPGQPGPLALSNNPGQA